MTRSSRSERTPRERRDAADHALFVAPGLVLLGGVSGPQPFALSFRRSEMGFLFVSVLLGTMVASDRRSNWFKGV